METLPPILLIDKPKGITSFDVIRILRKQTGVRKFGHAGTLDPLASGLMIIGVEKGTKLLEQYIKLDKEYVAEIRIGEKRSTGDLEGVVHEECEVSQLDEQALTQALSKLVGTQTLPVSAYSAIKQQGTPLYKKARAAQKKGETITELPMREMVVFEAELLGEYPEVIDEKKRHIAIVRFHVGSGTYVRSLAEELGRLLGYPATLQALRRTKIGEYKVEDAQALIQKEAELK